MGFTIKNLQSLISLAMEHNASDIHLRSGECPSFRIRGDLITVESNKFQVQDIVDICHLIFGNKKLLDNLSAINEVDGAFEIENLCRVRFNFFRYKGNEAGIVLRIIKNKIQTIEELGFSKTLKKIADAQRGLILITGATGSGKSTTMAALLERINHKRCAHIITIEDPIEYVFTSKNSKITQREIGTDTQNFTSALRSALRQDPDVIMIGEMRDCETISIALKAAETGHLVISTLHTTNAVATIGRIISMFHPEEQKDIRKRLAENLYATIGQRMLKTVDNINLVVAQEIMITSIGIKECIHGQVPLENINTIISHDDNKKRGNTGNQSFDDHIHSLYQKGIITKETAMEAATSESNFLQRLIVNN